MPEEPPDDFNWQVSAEDGEFLRNSGITIPLPETAPWHPILVQAVRLLFHVEPAAMPPGGEAWIVGKRDATKPDFFVIVLGTDENPDFQLAVRRDPYEEYRTPEDFWQALIDRFRESD